MGVSLKWLKQYVDSNWTADELAYRLTMAGIAVEGVEEQGEDHILDLDLTPNRGDCLGLINLAREVAALNGNKVRIPEINIKESREEIGDYITVEIPAAELCHRYAARLIKGVRVGSSPAWMQEALLASGVRPINNIVDVTNYVMLESNQPLHAFDYQLLSGKDKRIVVRRAYSGEVLTTLDEVERKLDEDMLLITDGERAVALAGVMGGMNTEINDDTRDVLLESAWFLGPNIRRTSRRLGLRSDASARFEKGTDIEGVLYAVDRAAALMAELAGGEVVRGVFDAYPHPHKQRQANLRPERVNQVLGTELTTQEIRDFLDRLQLKHRARKGQLVVDIPSYRPDIELEVDLIEEVARLYGYDRIPATLPQGDTTWGGLDPYQRFREEVREILAANLHEVINYSFINPDAFDRLRLPPEHECRKVVCIANPLSEEQSVMRTLLLPGLLGNVGINLARKNENPAFFEIGSIFLPQSEGLPREKIKVGAIVSGSTPVNWLKHNLPMDFYYLKGILENLFLRLGIPCSFAAGQEPCCHPGRTARVLCAGEEIGIIGEVEPRVLEAFDIRGRACAFELDLEKMFALRQKRQMSESITRYPGVERDIAVLLPDEVSAAQAIAVVQQAEGELLKEVGVFDVYRGEQVPDGFKSMALRLRFQSGERTLTDAEVGERLQRILAALENSFRASLRLDK